MKRAKMILLSALCIGTAALSSPIASAQTSYEVTITNLTKAQSFTPPLVVAHSPSISLFTPGEAASSGLEALAEDGQVAPLQSALEGLDAVRSVATGEGLIAPGASTTITVQARGRDVISLASMLIPTNDGFAALRSISLPRGRKTVTTYAHAWDAGTEKNDELCASIPGPFFEECNGSGGGGAPTDGAEGFIHIHNGIQGTGDFTLNRNFNNPVAYIAIKRTRNQRRTSARN